MLAGFFLALGPRAKKAIFTCCVPFDTGPLSRRFPQVEWRPYDEDSRRRSVEACDLWLGLGGSPFQNAVSRWFADHLASETRWCAAARKPMYFLGVGGQDPAAFAVRELRTAAWQAEMIWARDSATAEAIAGAAPAGKIRTAADLAHVFFEENPPPRPLAGRLCAVLNFDYAEWPALAPALEALAAFPASERIWLAQEARPLPGAELWLYDRLAPSEKARWRLQLADTPGASLDGAFARWPSAEWILTSRYHATLASAWAGSHAAVIATNSKLRGVARECGYPALPIDGDPASLPALLKAGCAPDRALLLARSSAARRACDEFAAAAGL